MSSIMSIVIAGGIAVGPAFVVRLQPVGFPIEQSIGIGLLMWFFSLILVVTPIRMAMENVRMTAKRLSVIGSENYDCERGYNWLRLRVENPTVAAIPNCYGKLCERKAVASELIKVDGVLDRHPIPPEIGGQSSENMQLPPEGHKFPWAPIRRGQRIIADTKITIPGFHSQEFLYFAVKPKKGQFFGFPTDKGMGYINYSLGDFEVAIEVGSTSEAFKPTRVCVRFRAEGVDLEVVSMEYVN